MFNIILKQSLAPNVNLFKIEAPSVAKKAQAGQFVVIRIDERGERIPLTIADWDRKEGTVSIVVMSVGTTTYRMAQLETGDSISDFIGPLGMPTHIDKFGTMVCVAGGFAVATIMPIARSMREEGNYVISIMGARSKELIFWENELRQVSDELIITTDDGTYGRQGLVTEPLKELLDSDRRIDRIIAIGPSMMMMACSRTTEPYGVKTIVSLNPIMVDGTGMCGCCRVNVGGETKFACVDGPDFDGHEVDWEVLFARQRSYLEQEKISFEDWKRQHGVQ